MKNKDSNKSKVDIAWEIYEHVFVTFKNKKARSSNRHPLGDPDRVEHDLSQVEQAHLDLLKTKLNMEIAEESRQTTEKLASKVYWLNVALFLLSFAMVLAACFELFQ
jgi:hypothetical protein